MVKNRVNPGLTWNDYPVCTLGSADNHSKALEKLNRALRKLSVTTDEENGAKSMIQTEKEVHFDVAPTFPSKTSSGAENSEEGAEKEDKKGDQKENKSTDVSQVTDEQDKEVAKVRVGDKVLSDGSEYKPSSNSELSLNEEESDDDLVALKDISNSRGRLKYDKKRTKKRRSENRQGSSQRKSKSKKQRISSIYGGASLSTDSSDDNSLSKVADPSARSDGKRHSEEVNPPTLSEMLSPKTNSPGNSSFVDYSFLDGDIDIGGYKTDTSKSTKQTKDNPEAVPVAVKNSTGKTPPAHTASKKIDTVTPNSSLGIDVALLAGVEIDAASAEILKSFLVDIEARLTEKIQSAKRSLDHDIRKTNRSIDALCAAVNAALKLQEANGQLALGVVADVEKVHCTKRGKDKPSLPFKSLESFEVFDESLVDETYKDFVKVLLCLYVKSGTHTGLTLRRSITTLIDRYISKNVALKYSGQGKGKLKKLNFSRTNFYRALESVIMTSEGCNSKIAMSAVSVVLAQSGDKEGGRQERREAEKKKEGGKDKEEEKKKKKKAGAANEEDKKKSRARANDQEKSEEEALEDDVFS